MRAVLLRFRSVLICLATLGAVGLLIALRGESVFSPGELSQQNRTGVIRGGVSSHAQLQSTCGACHNTSWHGVSMTQRCESCHQGVHRPLEDMSSLHAALAEMTECRRCHTEHHGAGASLTNVSAFDHSRTAFALTGAHVAVNCRACHQTLIFPGTPHACVACHEEPPVHRGKFGMDCRSCHTTDSWTRAAFAHSFPLNHGMGKNGRNACATCHVEKNDYATHTCYGCHRHDALKTEHKHLRIGVTEIAACAACHPNGRRRRDDPPKHPPLDDPLRTTPHHSPEAE